MADAAPAARGVYKPRRPQDVPRHRRCFDWCRITCITCKRSIRARAECPPHFAFAARLLREIRSARSGDFSTEALRSRVLDVLRAEGLMTVHP